MPDFYIKKGDTQPAIEAQLRYVDGGPVDLTGASIKFLFRPVDGGSTVTRTATIVDAAQGKVKYQWVTADTVTAGLYDAEWEVTFSDNTILTVPNTKFTKISIVDSL